MQRHKFQCTMLLLQQWTLWHRWCCDPHEKSLACLLWSLNLNAIQEHKHKVHFLVEDYMKQKAFVFSMGKLAGYWSPKRDTKSASQSINIVTNLLIPRTPSFFVRKFTHEARNVFIFAWRILSRLVHPFHCHFRQLSGIFFFSCHFWAKPTFKKGFFPDGGGGRDK